MNSEPTSAPSFFQVTESTGPPLEVQVRVLRKWLYSNPAITGETENEGGEGTIIY
jgi:hypothetical protein